MSKANDQMVSPAINWGGGEAPRSSSSQYNAALDLALPDKSSATGVSPPGVVAARFDGSTSWPEDWAAEAKRRRANQPHAPSEAKTSTVAAAKAGHAALRKRASRDDALAWVRFGWAWVKGLNLRVVSGLIAFLICVGVLIWVFTSVVKAMPSAVGNHAGPIKAALGN